MPLFKKQLANPKWIKEKRKKKWWELKFPQEGIVRNDQYESSFESDNAGLGSIAALIFGICVFGLMVGLVFLFNWVGKNYL